MVIRNVIYLTTLLFVANALEYQDLNVGPVALQTLLLITDESTLEEDVTVYQSRLDYDLLLPTELNRLNIIRLPTNTPLKIDVWGSGELISEENTGILIKRLKFDKKRIKDGKVEISLRGYLRYVSVEISAIKKFAKAPVVKIFTVNVPTLYLKSVDKAIKSEFEGSTYYQFLNTAIRKISLKVDNESTHKPKAEALYLEKGEQGYKKLVLKKSKYKNDTYDAILPRGFSTQTLKISDESEVKFITFYKEADFNKLGVSKSKLFTSEKALRVMKIKLLPKIRPENGIYEGLVNYMGSDGDSKSLYFSSKHSEIDVRFSATEIEVLLADYKIDFEVLGSPCYKKPCKNRGVCAVNGDTEEGFLCLCDKQFSGPKCEKIFPRKCKVTSNENVVFASKEYSEYSDIRYRCKNGVRSTKDIICHNGALYNRILLSPVHEDTICKPSNN